MTVEIITGDCREVLAQFPDASFDCILTDPPYGETSLQWDRWVPGWPGIARRLLKPTGSMWCFGSQRMFWDHRSDFDGWRLAQDIVWEKHNGSGFATDRFKRVHENALHFYRDDAPWGGVYANPQYTNDADARRLLYSCPPGGKVLDLFAGSGTTGVVAARHGMDAVLVEGRAEYVDVIRSRLANDAPLLGAIA